MRFLCLHGMGTNCHIFETQTAAIRHGLGDNHAFDFVEGSIPCPPAPGIEALASPDDGFFQYVDAASPASFIKGLDDLEDYIAEAGPFDAVMAFSQGAALAASLIMRKLQQDPIHQRLHPLFKCAVFFCGGEPGDPSAAGKGQGRLLAPETDGEVIDIPTAHIWGTDDHLYPTYGPVLSRLCSKNSKEEFIHSGGHEIPGSKDTEALSRSVRAIRRTIERALETQ